MLLVFRSAASTAMRTLNVARARGDTESGLCAWKMGSRREMKAGERVGAGGRVVDA